jgi:hypothetical protein
MPFVLRDFGVVRTRVRDAGGAFCRPLPVSVSQWTPETMA